MSEPNLDTINKQIAYRSNVFYWQTDRAVEPQDAGAIWADRHRYFADDEIVSRANEVLTSDQVVSIEPLVASSQTNLGNVNSVRSGVLTSGKEIIVRCHPKGIVNGYFHAEALAAQIAKDSGLPSYSTLAVHDFEGEKDFSFQVIEKLSGIAIKNWLELHPEHEAKMVQQMGITMAKLHSIKVNSFGPFNNQLAQSGELKGLHSSYLEAVNAGLDFNLGVLLSEGIVEGNRLEAIKELFSASKFIQNATPVLVHNDFADWNLLTDGNKISGILDWDECVGGSYIGDIACWSTFFEPERLQPFLDGYFSETSKPDDFNDNFNLLRLRYTISKMTLRIRRYTWDPTEFMLQKILIGKVHLQESLDYFGI